MDVGSPQHQPEAASAARLARFRELFGEHFGYVWTSLARLGVAEADREDVAHDVFLAVYRKLDGYDASRPVRPWLFAFAAGVASDYRRLARRKVDLVPDFGEISADAAKGEDLIEVRERHALVDAALSQVDDEKRAVLVLHELDDCPVPEVAVALGIPEGTAYSRLRAGRAQFASAVRRLVLQRKRP